jgi:hypothetical protein
VRTAVIDEIVAPDFIEHQNGSQGVGPEVVRRTASSRRASCPNLTLEIEDAIAVGDAVWVRVTGSACA